MVVYHLVFVDLLLGDSGRILSIRLVDILLQLILGRIFMVVLVVADVQDAFIDPTLFINYVNCIWLLELDALSAPSEVVILLLDHSRLGIVAALLTHFLRNLLGSLLFSGLEARSSPSLGG